MKSLLIASVVICIAITICLVCWEYVYRPGSVYQNPVAAKHSTKSDLEKIVRLLDSGKTPTQDIVTWRLLAAYASKTGRWKSLQSILDRISGIMEHSPTLAILYLECYRSNSGNYLLGKLQSALDENTAAYVLLYGLTDGDFDAVKEILTRFSGSVQLRLRAGQLLQFAVANNNRQAIEALNGFCYYFDREAAVQIAVHLDDMDLIVALDAVPLEQQWRYKLGLAAFCAAFDDRNENLFLLIYQHFSSSPEMYDKEGLTNAIYRKWYFTSEDMGDDWYDKVILLIPQETASIAEHNPDGYQLIQQQFIDGIILGDLPEVELMLSELKESDDLYANVLVAGCVVASTHKQQEILDKLLRLTDDRIRAGVIMVAGHLRDLHLLTAIVELPRLKLSIFIQSEIGRLMEHAVINEDDEMFSILLRFKDRDAYSTFGMIRASVYAIRHGDRHWVDAIFEELHILELRHVNRLLVHIIGAALETKQYQWAFEYWRMRFELNEYAMEIRKNLRYEREYANDADRVGFPASERYMNLGYGLILTSAPHLHPLPELLRMVVNDGYDIDVQFCEEKLMHLKSISREFWKRPERDPVPGNIYLPDYCKQRRPDLYPEFANTPPLPIPDGWHELAKAVLIDLQEWAADTPQVRRRAQDVPDHMRPINN